MNGRRSEFERTDSAVELIAESIPHIVWLATPDGSTRYFNGRGIAYTGHPPEANYGWKWVSLIHPEDAERAQRAWEYATQTETEFLRECRIRRADGDFVWHVARALPMRGPEGQVLYWIGTATNIHDQKQLESEMRRTERRSAETLALLETLYSTSPVGFGFVDREFRIVRMNESLAVINGAPLTEQIGRTVAELVPNLWPQLEGVYRAVLDTRRSFVNLEIAAGGVATPKENSYWLTSYYPVIVDDDVIGVGLVVVNITKRKHIEQSLRTAEEQFRSLIEQTISGIYIIQDGQFIYVNARCAQIFGYSSSAEVIGLDPLLLVAETDRALVEENIRRRLEGSVSSLNYTFKGLRKDGAVFDVGVHGSVATYGGRAAIVGTLQDVSEKLSAEERIRAQMVQLENAFMHTVEVAMKLSEMRDPYTAGHERRVAEIAVALGAELGIDADRLEGLRVAGYLHDIGKIMIPAEILAKPTKLTAVEYELIKAHPTASYDVLKGVEFRWPVAAVALQHHERLDGSGYPQGLKGDAILLEARILAVADVVEAMSLHRPYRPGLGTEVALAEIERGRGVSYDSTVVDACLRLFREKRYSIPP